MISITFALAVIALIFASGYRTALFFERRKSRISPSRIHMALSTGIHREIRAARSEGPMNGWALAHRTDSEPLSTK